MRLDKKLIFQARNPVETRNRVFQALNDYPDLNFGQLAQIAGVSRMHLYRLARRYQEIREAYTEALSLKRDMAEIKSMDDLMSVLHGSGGFNYKENYALSQKVMRYNYYLSRWENRIKRIQLIYKQ